MKEQINTSTQFLSNFFFNNFPRKAVALLSAVVIWFLVNHTLTATKTFPEIAVRIIHLPPHKTIPGMYPTGILNKKIPVTFRGTKSAIENLTPNDLEILINAAGREESFIAKIDKKNLFLLSHDEKIKNNISEVSTADLFIKMSDLVTEEIPLTITDPLGEPPPGFQYLDIFPKHLIQKVSGPKEEVEALKQKGLTLTFDLDKMGAEELEAIHSMQGGTKSDEVTFFIPQQWKKVVIPFNNNALENINDARAQYLRIDLLKKEFLYLGTELPISVFYPVSLLPTFNPEEYHLAKSDLIEVRKGVPLLQLPLYVGGVSRQFLDIVREHLVLSLIPDGESTMQWSLDFISVQKLEEAFLASFSTLRHENTKHEEKHSEDKYNTETLRKRFCNYLRAFQLFKSDEKPLQLEVKVEDKNIFLLESS